MSEYIGSRSRADTWSVLDDEKKIHPYGTLLSTCDPVLTGTVLW
jgi:hypothetical protein